MNLLMIKGIVLFATGICLVLLASKREFDRTNDYGVEQYKTFAEMASAKLINGAYRWLGVISFLLGGLIIFGIQVHS